MIEYNCRRHESDRARGAASETAEERGARLQQLATRQQVWRTQCGHMQASGNADYMSWISSNMLSLTFVERELPSGSL